MSSAYRRVGAMEEWNIRDLVFQGSLLHQTWWSFEKLALAKSTLCFRAIFGGVVQEVREPTWRVRGT